MLIFLRAVQCQSLSKRNFPLIRDPHRNSWQFRQVNLVTCGYLRSKMNPYENSSFANERKSTVPNKNNPLKNNFHFHRWRGGGWCFLGFSFYVKKKGQDFIIAKIDSSLRKSFWAVETQYSYHKKMQSGPFSFSVGTIWWIGRASYARNHRSWDGLRHRLANHLIKLDNSCQCKQLHYQTPLRNFLDGLEYNVEFVFV